MDEGLKRYRPDTFTNVRTREQVEGYCVPDEEGDYVLYADHVAYTEAMRKALEAADRLLVNNYLGWHLSGGPDECTHGIASGIACKICDQDLVRTAALAARADEQGDGERNVEFERVKSRLLGMEDAISAFSDDSLIAENKKLHEAIENFWKSQAEEHQCGCDEWPECSHTLHASELRKTAMGAESGHVSKFSATKEQKEINALRKVLHEARDFIASVDCEEGLTWQTLVDKIDAALACTPAPSAELPTLRQQCVCGHSHREDGTCTVCISCRYTPITTQPPQAQASAEMDVVRGRPVWVQQLTELQQEFAEVSGKTFHSTWEDFLFVKLRAARVALAEARKDCYTAARLRDAMFEVSKSLTTTITWPEFLNLTLAALAAKEPK